MTDYELGEKRVDWVFAHMPVMQRLRADFAFARAFGFGAKLCIHPKQVAVIHAACQPSDEELAWAERVLVAAAASEGAVQLDGRMVDRPVVLKAQAIVARARSGESV